jgi:hypothetical protein
MIIGGTTIEEVSGVISTYQLFQLGDADEVYVVVDIDLNMLCVYSINLLL